MRQGEYGQHYLVVANGKGVIVKHTDKGPRSKKRVCDLSKAAIAVLEPRYKDKGLLKVKVYKLSPFGERIMTIASVKKKK